MAKMFFPQYARGREGIELCPGDNILQHIRRIGGIEIDSECGGRGDCGKDIVRIDGGSECLAEMTSVETRLLEQGRLKSNRRLACQAGVINGAADIRVFIPDFGRYTILTDCVESHAPLAPCAFRKGDRVLYSTGEDLGPYQGGILGLALDVGTTTLVMQVIDLETGENVGSPIAAKNPQIAYGNDVISRIGYAMEHEYGLTELQQSVVEGVNDSLHELARRLDGGQASITKRIYDVVAVGNSTMRSIFFGQNVHDLGVIPFEPSSKRSLTRRASGLGLDTHPRGMAYAPPLIGGHAGADCVADIIATELYLSDEIEMIIDIGTNGEIVIGNKNKIMTASCAAGGAYEGYQITCGVGAIEGAITKLEISDGKVKYATLGDKPPLGICGSGVIDLLAELLRNGIMNEKARIVQDYHITDSIGIAQNDINQLIVAKAGLRADQDLLVKYYGTTLGNVSRIYLAGAFGNYMDIDNAMAIGLLPQAENGKFVRFGNGALAGARDMLISQAKRRDAEQLAERIEHTKPNEIEGVQFQYIVAENMYF
ncbi:MAG TPA: DUF4445 domain-containing protein [Candidatus Hydrogenedentes bacterium]|nr:DUF4445 domain-containing protein [Candidatus Hydrogenedentota bacterium]